MLADGQWISALSGATQPITDPPTGQVFASVPAAGPEHVDRAVVPAFRAFAALSWAHMRPADRERRLLRLADLLEAHAAEFAELETFDNGKPITLLNRVDVPWFIEYLRYIAGWATKLEGVTVDVSFPRQGGEYFAYARWESWRRSSPGTPL